MPLQEKLFYLEYAGFLEDIQRDYASSQDVTLMIVSEHVALLANSLNLTTIGKNSKN
jgi:hypothetical protein